MSPRTPAQSPSMRTIPTWIQDANTADNPRTHHRTAVRLRVAEHPATTASALNDLSEDTDRRVRQAVAAHPNTPAHALDTLAHRYDSMFGGILIDIAANPNTPPHTLAYLLEDGNAAVRETAAAHPNTPPQALNASLTKRGWDIGSKARIIVISHPATSNDAIAYRIEHGNRNEQYAGHRTRIKRLHQHADTLPEPTRSQALLLIESGFPGWPTDLDTILSSSSPTAGHTPTASQPQVIT